MSEWISVEDDLPKKNQQVFILLKDNSIVLSKYNAMTDDDNDPWETFNCYRSRSDITHWAPIIFPSLPIEPLKLEVGKVYEDKEGRRYLIYLKESDEMFNSCVLSVESEFFYWDHSGKTLNSDDTIQELIKLSDNQFPGVI